MPDNPKRVFVDSEIRVFEGEAAGERLKEQNDLPYLTEGGILQVDRDRWQEAQRYERKTWMENQREADDDRNYEHEAHFDGYAVLAGRRFARVIEFGCGPFTNLRLALRHIPTPDHVTLLDPLIREYLQHPHCTYREGRLCGVPVECIASAIEEFEPGEPYDLLVMVNVLEHCFDVSRIFDRILRCLEPGGILVFGDNVFRPEQLPTLLERQFDAGHPIRVAEPVVAEFLRDGFAEIYHQRFHGLHDQPHRIDVYSVGVRVPFCWNTDGFVFDLPAWSRINADDMAVVTLRQAAACGRLSGDQILAAGELALKAGRIHVAEAAVELAQRAGAARAGEFQQRVVNFRNNHLVTVGQILADSKLGGAIREVMRQHRPQSILDLGAAAGLGSTTVLAKAALELGLKPHIYAIESAAETFQCLVQNTAAFQTVRPLRGTLVNPAKIPSWPEVLEAIRSRPNHVLERVPLEELEHWYQHAAAETVALWREQGSVLQRIPESRLDLVIIDADLFFAREALAAVLERSNILVLDDVAEHKNASNHEFLSQDPDWELMGADFADRHGWSIFKRRRFLGEPASRPTVPAPRRTIHFAYSGDPRHDAATRAPATITNRIFRFLEQRAHVRYYDFGDTTTPLEVGPEDIVVGHPHPQADSVMRRLLRTPCMGKHLIFPFHWRIPEINRFAKEIAADAQKLFVISGPYWIDEIGATEYADWKDKIVRLDNAIDLDFFALQKSGFNAPGQRGLLVLGRSGAEKGTPMLFEQLCSAPGRLLVAGEFTDSDLAILASRPNTKVLGTLDWRNPAHVERVLRKCDFFVNFSVSDASPTTLFEAMALGLIPVTTPQCGYTYPTFVFLSLADPEHNLIALRNLQHLPESHLRALQHENRRLVETNHNWGRFLDTFWQGLTGERPASQAAQTDSHSGLGGAQRNAVASRNEIPPQSSKFRPRPRIAADQCPAGAEVNPGSSFASALADVIALYRPTRLIETGTYHGTGTTAVITRALRDARLKDARFVTLEVNPANARMADENLRHAGLREWCDLRVGLSVPRGQLPTASEVAEATIHGVESAEIFVDHSEAERVRLYLAETDFPDVPDNLLGQALVEFGHLPDFVLLDSAGHMGFVEFQYLLGQLQGPCLVALDDVFHVKHHGSLKMMQDDPRFEIITLGREKFGFVLARFTPASSASALSTGPVVVPDDSVRRLLWVRTDSIGDAVLAASMLPWIQRKYPKAEIAVLCQKHVADLYLRAPGVRSIICFEPQGAETDAGRGELLGEIGQFAPQLVLNSTYSRDSLSDRLTLAFRDAKHVAIRADLSNLSEPDRAAAEGQYEQVIQSPGAWKLELDRHRDFLRGLGVEVPELKPVVWTGPEDDALAEAFFKEQQLDSAKTIALFPGAQHDCRVYAHYAEAVKELAGFSFLIFGGVEFDAAASAMAPRFPGKAVNLCGRTSLREMAALLRRCRLFVGSESVGAHMACAVGVPNIVLMGGGHFGRFMPYSPLTSLVCLPLDCFGCNWRCRFSRAHCVKDLSPVVLAEAVRQTLAGPANRPRLFLQTAESWREGANRPKWARADKGLGGTPVQVVEISALIALPVEAQRLVSHAESALAKGGAASAVQALEQARLLAPRHPELLTALANLYFQDDRIADAKTALAEAVEANPTDSLLPVLLAHVCLRLEDAAGFEAALSRALQLDPAYPPALRLLADMHRQSGRFAEAARIYGDLVQRGTADLDVLLALGQCSAQTGDLLGARRYYQAVLRGEPANTVAEQSLVEIEKRLGKAQFPSREVPPDHERVTCPVCGHSEGIVVRSRADIVECASCRTVYLRTRLTQEAMRRLYQSYANEGSHMALPNSVEEAERSGLAREYFLKEILQFTEPTGAILDVGCGWGGFLLNARKHGFQPRGIELTRKCVRYANDTLGIPVMDTQLESTEVAAGSLRVVTVNHVLEHLPVPREAAAKVFACLEPGGMFCGMVPNFASACSLAEGDAWYWLDPHYHYTHFTPATLRKLLEDAGFIIERLYTATGDYGAENVRKACLKGDPRLSDADYFARELKRYEAERRGEEIRFFARKPSTVAHCTPKPTDTAEPLVSVIVSTVNSERLIRPCLENLTRQTIFNQIEVLVVDSGSEQNERALVEQYQKRHPNIRYLRSERETLYAAWNRGLAAAHGRYWVNANTDDSLRDDALELLVNALAANPGCQLAYADCLWTAKANDRFPSAHALQEVRYPNYEPVHTWFYCLTGCLQFWRTEALRQLGGFDSSLRYAGDYEITLRLAAARGTATHVREFLSLFYQNTAGLTQHSSASSEEHARVEAQARATMPIDRLFACRPGNALDEARAWTALGVDANDIVVPWEREHFKQEDFAFTCFRRAFETNSECPEACLNYLLALEHTGRGNLIQRLESAPSPTVRDALARFRSGASYQRPDVQPALGGTRFDPAQARPELLAAEPPAIRPWVSRQEGRFTYLSERLIPRPAGPRYTTEELQQMGVSVFKILAAFPPFHAHFGGAGDALLLLSTFYDRQPGRRVFSYPNSIPAARAFFEAFPGLGQVYFLPPSDDSHVHALLRWIMRSLPNCLGAGATPKAGYDEWGPGLDIAKAYKVNMAPRWATAFRTVPQPKQVALAPKGSQTGMVGSKRNTIAPAVWPELVRSVLESGYHPVLLGTPDERHEYAALDGCEDRRSFSFHEQMEHIANSAVFIGADSWGKTFSALAGVPTIVFEPIKGVDWIGKKDASDFVFLDPWDAITVVKNLAQCREVFGRITGSASAPKSKPDKISLPLTKPMQVAWQGSFLDLGSLAHVNRELTRQMARCPLVHLTRIGTNGLPKEHGDVAELKEVAATLKIKPAKDTQVTVRHAWPPDWQRPECGALVVIQPWEYGALPEQWVRDARNVTQFWVPSEYVRQAYVASGVPAAKVRVVPNGIDPERFHPGAPPMQLPTKKSFKFLFVGGTIHRKGADVLLDAYLKTFTRADDVCLVLKDFGGHSVYAGQTLDARIQAAKAMAGAPEIVHLTEELSPEELPALYTACDCLVHPYRGEGFGLPILEAMACGLPVIVTAGGAADDFASEEYTYRIPATRRFFGDVVSGLKLAAPGWLLEPDPDALAARIKWITEHRDEARAKGRRASEHARREWTWARAAQVAEERLHDLCACIQTKAAPAAGSLPRKSNHFELPCCALLGHLGKPRDLLGRKKLPESWEATLAANAARPFHPEAFLLLAEVALAAGDSVAARQCAAHAQQLAPGWKAPRQFLKQNPRGNAKHDWLVLPEEVQSPKSKVQSRLSVCLIVKNEEHFLAQCLQSVRGLAHQIVVVDTGSTDRTVEIAKAHGAEVHSFAWGDDFSAARNAALEHATGDWILVLDADEELPAASHEALKQEMRAATVMAYRLPIADAGKEDEGCSYVPRLFRNAPGLFFAGRIHEHAFGSVEARRKPWGLENRLGTARLLHHGYAGEVTRDRSKVQRNLRLLELALAESPDDANLLLNLGLELVRSGDRAGGLERYREAFRLASALPSAQVSPELRETLLTQFSTHLMAAREFAEAVRVLTAPVANAGGLTASLHFTLGLAHVQLEQFSEAAAQMRQCLAKRNQPALTPVNPEIQRGGPEHCLARCLAKLKQDEAAEEAFRAGLAAAPQSRGLRLDYAGFLFERGRPVEALHLLNALVAEQRPDAEAWRLGGEIALSRAEFLEFAADWTAEAIKQLPSDPQVVAQRAEVLMLQHEAVAAQALWRQVCEQTAHPRHQAAWILCETLSSPSVGVAGAGADEVQTSRAFVDWYRRLVAMGAARQVECLNTRRDRLRQVLPTAGRVLDAVMAEVERG